MINGENKGACFNGSGYVSGLLNSPGYQGGSSYVDPKYESGIRQNTKIPIKFNPNRPYTGVNVPYIEIKLLKWLKFLSSLFNY